jgi:hypothetical protein
MTVESLDMVQRWVTARRGVTDVCVMFDEVGFGWMFEVDCLGDG